MEEDESNKEKKKKKKQKKTEEAAPEKEKIDLKNSLKEFIQQGKWDELRSMQNVIMDSLVDEPGLVDARLLRVSPLLKSSRVIVIIGYSKMRPSS